MKKLLLSLGLLLQVFFLCAQNIQLHYDFRRGLHPDVAKRNYPTATFEMFKPDKWGSTFMFVDLDFNQSRGNIGLAYMEIARDFKLGKCPVMAHVEFNGGVGKNKHDNSGFSVANAYLAGASCNRNFGGVNIGTYIAYKYNAFEKVSNDIQWTTTWGANILDNKITLTGFIDVWTENKNLDTSKGGKKFVLLTEPQIWYNLTSNLSFGSEIEISNNFYRYYNNKLYVCPTFAGKWTF